MTNNAFAKFTADLDKLAALAALAAPLFDGAEGLISVRSYSDRTVTVQMHEFGLLAWCEAHGVTPTLSESEVDYTAYGGGYTTVRRREAVVSESEVGRVLLVSAEVVSTRPAPLQGEGAGESAGA